MSPVSMFYFDCFDGESHVADDYGIDLTTEAEARDHAVALMQTLVGDAQLGVEARSIAVTVRAADGLAVYVAHCSFTERWTEDPAPAAAGRA